jgi:hypothetical protein
VNAEAELIQQEFRAQIHGEVPESLLKPAGIGGFLISSNILDVGLALRYWGPTHRVASPGPAGTSPVSAGR